MERVTIDQIEGKPIGGSPVRKVPVWRVRLDGCVVGYIFEADAQKGRVHFCKSNLEEDEIILVRETVADQLGVSPSSTIAAPIMPEKPEEMPDYGDF